jgi:hypothetical protein
MCSFARHTTFMKIGIANFECKVVKNAKTGTGTLFLGAEFLVNLHCRSCSNQWEKTPRAFGIFVEGNLLGNIGIQSLDHLYFENWRIFECIWVKRNCWCNRRSRARRRVAHPPRRSRLTRAARARWGAGGPSGPRLLLPPLCARACDACMEA